MWNLKMYYIEAGLIRYEELGRIENDTGAEDWVSYSYFHPRVTTSFFRWVLRDAKGFRCAWEVRDGIPMVTQRTERFSGQKALGKTAT